MEAIIVPNPVGADYVIDQIQKSFLSGLPFTDGKIYGRAQKNKGDIGFLPQFNDGTQDYIKDLYLEDIDSDFSIFFILEDQQKSIGADFFECKAKIVVMINLDNHYGISSKRMDLEAQRSVYQVLKNKKSFTITGIETGLETVLKGFDYSKILKSDLQPNHIFALVGKLKYNINKC